MTDHFLSDVELDDARAELNKHAKTAFIPLADIRNPVHEIDRLRALLLAARTTQEG